MILKTNFTYFNLDKLKDYFVSPIDEKAYFISINYLEGEWDSFDFLKESLNKKTITQIDKELNKLTKNESFYLKKAFPFFISVTSYNVFQNKHEYFEISLDDFKDKNVNLLEKIKLMSKELTKIYFDKSAKIFIWNKQEIINCIVLMYYLNYSDKKTKTLLKEMLVQVRSLKSILDNKEIMKFPLKKLSDDSVDNLTIDRYLSSIFDNQEYSRFNFEYYHIFDPLILHSLESNESLKKEWKDQIKLNKNVNKNFNLHLFYVYRYIINLMKNNFNKI